MNGTDTRPIRQISTLVICPRCKGHGVNPGARAAPCTFCKGDRVLIEVIELHRLKNPTNGGEL